MANINENPYYRANRSLNGFDMSEWLQFSCSTGMLLPISFDLLHPGEKLQINSRAFIRTETLTSSAFVRMRYRIEYFFVPFPQLFSYFGSCFYGIHDYHSTTLDGPRSALIQSRYPSFSTDQLAEYLDSLRSYKDEQGYSYVAGVHRLLDCFTISRGNEQGQTLSSNNTDIIPFYWFQAYQRVFDAFYRNDAYEETNMYSYNVDDLWNNNWSWDSEQTSFDSRFLYLFKLRYRNYPRDYFTNVQPSPLFNNTSVDSLFPLSSNELFNSQVPGAYNNSLSRLGFYKENGYTVRPSTSTNLDDGRHVSNTVDAYSIGDSRSTVDANKSLVSASSIRQMFAVEKLLSITQRTKKTYEAQTLAHFGYDVPDQVGNKVFFIGAHEGKIMIQDVNATATTDGDRSSDLGEVAGKGIGFNGNSKTLKFTAPWHGVYLAIFSIVPDVIYDNNLVSSRLVRTSRFNEFYRPEFDRIGMASRYGFEYLYNDGELDTRSVGFSYNYYWLKSKYDRSFGSFNYTSRNWTAKRVMPETIENYTLPYSFFYYSPFSLNDIMLVPFDAMPDDGRLEDMFLNTYNKDPFLCDIDLNVKKVSDMSVYGLPQL